MKITQRKRFLGYINRDEEIFVDKVTGRVFAREKFDIDKWAESTCIQAYRNGVVFHTCMDGRVTTAIKNYDSKNKPGIAICNPMDAKKTVVGRAIAYCRLIGKPIPKEIFD